MLPITINIPNDEKARVVDALCAAGGWTSDKGSKEAFFKNVLIDYIVNTVRNVEQTQAEQVLQDQVVVVDLDGLT